jgi:hypothetical protein
MMIGLPNEGQPSGTAPPYHPLTLLISFTCHPFPLHTGCTKIDGVDDAAEFKEVLQAMNTLQFSASTVESMLKALAGILLLGECVLR